MTVLEVVEVIPYPEFEVTVGIEIGGRQTNPVSSCQTPSDNRRNSTYDTADKIELKAAILKLHSKMGLKSQR